MGEAGGVPESCKLRGIGWGLCLDPKVDGWKLRELGLGGGSCCCCSIMICWLLCWLEMVVESSAG